MQEAGMLKVKIMDLFLKDRINILQELIQNQLVPLFFNTKMCHFEQSHYSGVLPDPLTIFY